MITSNNFTIIKLVNYALTAKSTVENILKEEGYEYLGFITSYSEKFMRLVDRDIYIRDDKYYVYVKNVIRDFKRKRDQHLKIYLKEVIELTEELKYLDE